MISASPPEYTASHLPPHTYAPYLSLGLVYLLHSWAVPLRIELGITLPNSLNMRGLSSRLVLRPRRRLISHPGPRVQARSFSSPDASSLDTDAHTDAQFHDPAPSELLRITLTAATTPVIENEPTSTLRKQVLKLLDTEWKLNSPPPALWCALKGVYPMFRNEEVGRLRAVEDLSSLRHVVERLAIDKQGAVRMQRRNCEVLREVLGRCQRHNTSTEILSTLSDIITRLQRLELFIKPQLYELGMYYAALDLSAPALRKFLEAYHQLASSQVIPVAGGRVIRALIAALESALFENPHHNTKLLLAEVTGEGEAKPQSRPALLDTLLGTLDSDWQNWAMYLRLLSRLQSSQTLESSWSRFLEVLDSEDQRVCHSAYTVVVALIQAGRSEIAVKFLEDISQRSEDNLPFIATFGNLQALLDDPVVGDALPDLVQGNHYEELLETRLKNMEQRLGIQWKDTQRSTDNKAHFGITPGSPWTIFKDQPLFTIDGNCAGYEDSTRLYPELQAHGCSKSTRDLGRLVNLLDEQDGNVQDIVTHLDFDKVRLEWFHSEFPDLQLRWCPEHSPIEFSDSLLPTMLEQPSDWTPSSLGLLRARLIVNGVPQSGTTCLHLMQLGSLDMRHGPNEAWQPSGYIVAWDRQYGEMIALFVGKNYGVINSGPTPPDAPFGAAMHIRPSNMANALPLSPNHLPRDSVGPYYLDLDPSPDLGFR